MLIKQLLALREAANADGQLQIWKDAVKKKYPNVASKLKFKSKDQGKHISAEIDGEDRSYGVFDVSKSSGQVLDEARITENADNLSDVIDQWCVERKIHNWEGQHSVQYFKELLRALNDDYRDFDDFLMDNSGAVEVLINWLTEQNDPSWIDNVKNDIKAN